MVVISGIIQTILKVAPIVYRVATITYKAGSKTRQGKQWISRHPKALRYGTAAAGGASLLLDLTNIDYSAIIPPKKPSRKIRQTRTNIYGLSNRRVYNTKCKPLPRRSRRR